MCTICTHVTYYQWLYRFYSERMPLSELSVSLREKYKKQGTKNYKYGTAGFRDKAEGMDFIMFRMGLLAALRAQCKKAAIGVMITASHNPSCDNGVKLIDPKGEMLAVEWEEIATRLVNVDDTNITEFLLNVASDYGINIEDKCVVLTAKDTRPSSAPFQAAVQEGASILGAEVIDFGIVSTPVLHYVVTCYNDGGMYGKPTLMGYFEKLTNSFVRIRQDCNIRGNYKPEIYFDGANGVGALMMSAMMPHLKDSLHLQIFNQGEGTLNLNCGTDFVKTYQKPPSGVPQTPNKRIVSVDGDADRVLYSYFDENGKFQLLDGDKIATLIAEYLKNLVEKAGLNLNMGVVQTAYANGASTRYMEAGLGMKVLCVDTGVKHLHHAALKFDIGVYFEANGHGTVVFSNIAKNVIEKTSKEGDIFASELKDIICIINETVGDAISDMLLVETILLNKGWSCKEWNHSYKDYPNKLAKVKVKDRYVVETTDAARICVKPEGLQSSIDALVSKYEKARAFVRPSGTEDIVRIYAEAAKEEDVLKLCFEVANAVYEQAGGIGPIPT